MSHPGHGTPFVPSMCPVIILKDLFDVLICSVAEDDDAVAAKYNYYNV